MLRDCRESPQGPEREPLAEGQLFLSQLTFARRAFGLGAMGTLVEHHRVSLLDDHGGDEAKADMALFRAFGSSGGGDTMDHYYDAVDRGFFFRLKLALESRLQSPVAMAWSSTASVSTRHFVLLLAGATFYYADLAKDSLIVAQFKAKVLGTADFSADDFANNTYPMAVFCLLLGSIVVTELLNAATVLCRAPELANLGFAGRILLSLLTPLLPGILMYCERRLLVDLAKVVQEEKRRQATGGRKTTAGVKFDDSVEEDETVINNQKNLDSDPDSTVPISDHAAQLIASKKSLRLRAHSLRARLRANENSAEHFVQLAVFAAVALAERSSTRPVQTVGNIVVDSGQTFVLLSASVSFVSLVRGHVERVAAGRAGNLPLAGKAILGAYFVCGALGRVAAVVVLFTPLLGLFDVLKMSEVGLRRASTDTTYDLRGNVSLAAAWGSEFQLGSMSDLFSADYVAWMYVGLIAGLLLAHLAAGFAIGRPLGRSWDAALHTIVCPPIFLDWEEWYRNSSDQCLGKCWRRSMNAFYAFVVMMGT